MEAKPKPYPWTYFKSRTLIRIETAMSSPEPGIHICSLVKANETDAKRIVECVNAMYGIDDPQGLVETHKALLDCYKSDALKNLSAYDKLMELARISRKKLGQLASVKNEQGKKLSKMTYILNDLIQCESLLMIELQESPIVKLQIQSIINKAKEAIK